MIRNQNKEGRLPSRHVRPTTGRPSLLDP
jgi:hypothetical protein